MPDDPRIGQLSLFEALERRDAALQQVSCNAEHWTQYALSYLEAALSSLPDSPFTSEVIRRRIEDNVGSPHHPNAWGALINTAVQRGWIRATGTTENARGEKAHGRRLLLYRKGVGY